MNRIHLLLSRGALHCASFIAGCCLFVTVVGCKPSADAVVVVSPSTTLAPRQQATVSLSGDLPQNAKVLWVVNAGSLTSDPTALSTKCEAPAAPGPVTVSCSITVGGNRVVKNVQIEVVGTTAAPERLPQSPTTPAPTAPVAPVAQVPAAATPQAALPPGPIDIDQVGFVPSGFMGDAEAGETIVQVDPASMDDPHSAPTCQKWTCKPGVKGWAGVAWQYPDGNWGTEKGLDLRGRGIRRVSFWARGSGTEVLQFKAGGNTQTTAPYKASFAAATSFIKLERGWRQYTIDLQGKELSNVASAFTWVAKKADNPTGVTFYLDDVRYE